jgi:CheY-like chemotaxis protein
MVSRPPAKTLLIVEDQPPTREALASIFRGEGYRVLAAASAGEARRCMQGPSFPSVIVLDTRIGGEDAQDFLEQRRHDPALSAVPIILLTDEEANPPLRDPLEAAGSLRKPVSIDRLLDLIQNLA